MSLGFLWRIGRWRFILRKKYVVRLSDAERKQLKEIVKKLSGGSQKVRRANILLAADADGPDWTDGRIAEAYHCRPQTVENVRKRFVTRGFEGTLRGRVHQESPRPKKLDGRQEAQLIALRLGEPPKGRANWSLRLLAEKFVELNIVDSVSYETVRRTLKKMELPVAKYSTG